MRCPGAPDLPPQRPARARQSAPGVAQLGLVRRRLAPDGWPAATPRQTPAPPPRATPVGGSHPSAAPPSVPTIDRAARPPVQGFHGPALGERVPPSAVHRALVPHRPRQTPRFPALLLPWLISGYIRSDNKRLSDLV